MRALIAVTSAIGAIILWESTLRQRDRALRWLFSRGD
jgi:hypothetical protein